VAKRDPVEEPFLRSLQRGIKNFSKENPEVQHRLAMLIWNIDSKKREHSRYPGWASISYQELESQFGRDGFNQINDRLRIFDVSGEWSKKQNYTKAYRLTLEVQKIKTSSLSRTTKELSKLVLEDGSYLQTPPKALASKDMDGFTKTGFKNLHHFKPCVPVDVNTLKNLRKNLRNRKKQIEVGYWHRDLFFQEIAPGSIQRYIDEIGQVLRKANTQACGRGRVQPRYKQSRAGRLYADGINLQNAKTAIKQAALHGLWEYDFENCHYSIFYQVVQQAGMECPYIKDYCSSSRRKNAVRRQIANEAQISVKNVKKCLLFIMYGAPESVRPEDAICEELGSVDAAKNLYQNPLFTHIYEEVKLCKAAVYKRWPSKKRNKLHYNAMERGIDKKEKSNKILAHLMQGIEAKMLNIVLDLYPDKILLLQHDGFVAEVQLDKQRVIKKIKEDTGFDMKLSEERIQMGLEIIYTKLLIL